MALERGRGEVEPVAVRGAGAVLQDVVERPEPAPRVVEHPVEDDAHAACVGRVQQLAQGVVAAQERVDLQVVERVVAVVGGRLEDRGEVDRRDARGPRGTASRSAMPRRSPPLNPWSVGGASQASSVPGLRTRERGGEPVREDLVEDRVANPLRGVDGHGYLVRSWACRRSVGRVAAVLPASPPRLRAMRLRRHPLVLSLVAVLAAGCVSSTVTPVPATPGPSAASATPSAAPASPAPGSACTPGDHAGGEGLERPRLVRGLRAQLRGRQTATASATCAA